LLEQTFYTFSMLLNPVQFGTYKMFSREKDKVVQHDAFYVVS